METYYEQLHARYYKKLMCKPRDDFAVCDEYLQGLNKADFINAYRKLHEIYARFYSDMERNPETFGLPLVEIEKYPSNTPKARQTKIYQIPAMLHCLTVSGRFGDGVFAVDANKLLSQIKLHKIAKKELLLNRLSGYGFFISDWDGKNFTSDTFTFEYPDNPNILFVLRAVARKTLKLSNAFCHEEKIHLLYYKIFEDNSENIGGIDIDDYHDVLGGQAVFIGEFTKFMQTKEFMAFYNGFYRISYRKKDKENHQFYTFHYNKYNLDLEFRLRLANISKYLDYINDLPKDIKTVFENGVCHHCACDCKNIKYTLDDLDKEACIWNSFVFRNPKIEDIEYYKTLFELEQQHIK